MIRLSNYVGFYDSSDQRRHLMPLSMNIATPEENKLHLREKVSGEDLTFFLSVSW